MEKLSELFLIIVNMSLTAGLLVPFIFLMRAVMGKAPKSFAYALWGIIGFRLICPFSVSSVFSMFNLPFLKERMSPGNTTYWDGALQTQKIFLPNVNETGRAAERIQRAGSEIQHGAWSQTPVNMSGNGWNLGWTELLACVWAAGMLVFLVYECISWVKLKKQVEKAVRYEASVYECDGISSPFVMGIRKPSVYIPFRLSEEEREYILLHERYHICRKDYVIKFAAVILLAVNWFNPLIWAAFYGMCADMEMSCDEWVLKKLGNSVKKEYSASLLSFAAGHKIPVVSPLAFGESSAKTRIKNILKFQKKGKTAAAAGAVILLAAVIFGITNGKQGNYMQLQYQGGNVTAPEGMTLQYKVPENINSFLIYKEMYHEGRFSEYEVLQHGSFAKDEIPRDGNVTLQSSTQTSAENAYWERTLHWKSEDKASYDNTTELLLYNGVAEEYAADQVRTKEKYKLAETSDIIIGAWHLESQNSGVSAIPCKTLMEAEGDARRKLLGKNAGIILWHVVLSEKDSETLAKEYEVSGLARKLYALRTPYIGNASAVGKLLQELNISVLGKFTMELETSEEPYVLRMNFEKEPQKGDVFEKAMFDYAVLMLSLVENAGEVQWTYPMEGGQTLYTGYCDAAAANAFAHTDDIKKESESVQQLQKMMDYIGFSEKEVVQVVHTEDGYLAPDGEIYRYRTVVKGTLPNASRSSIYVVYSDKKDITFEEVSDHFLSSMLKKEPRMYVSLDELKERR